MTTIIALVLLSGAACSSPMEQATRETVAYKTPCAIVVRAPTANPFKMAQMPNTVTAPAKAVPVYKYAPKKKKKRKKARR